MLTGLSIKNIALIERAEIEFGEGFNALTGETGSGKSIIIDSINAVIGERTSRDLIRTGCSSGSVAAVFEHCPSQVLSRLSELGCIVSDDGTVMLSRRLSSDGRNICRVNGGQVTAAILREAAAGLINIHGQHDGQALLNPAYHCGYIDSVGCCEKLLENYRKYYNEYRKIYKEYKSAGTDESEKARILDTLEFQINELEAAKIKPGEKEKLQNKRELLLNIEKLSDALQKASCMLLGNEDTDGAFGLLKDSSGLMSDCSRWGGDYEKYSSRLSEMAYEVEEIGRDIQSFSENGDIDSGSLNDIDDRLDLYYRLSKKYGENEEKMIEFLDNAKKRREEIVFSDKHIKELEKKLDDCGVLLKKAADELTEKRKKTALEFSKKVCSELTYLDMPDVCFDVSFKKCSLNKDGGDEVEFLISANRGEELKPLSKVASGGELSRVMLAIKSVLTDCDDINTLIFDEIDTGISGRAAGKVGRRMKYISSNRQVICVTHLAQIAALADNHLLIEKSQNGDRTVTNITPLDYEGRKKELARIIGGDLVTENTLRSAEEMMAEKI